MADVVFEYKDDQGWTHRVSSLERVPKKYLDTMTAVDRGTPEASGREIRVVDSPFRLPGKLEQVHPAYILLPVMALVYFRSRNYVVRLLIVALLALWLAFRLYLLFERQFLST